MVESLSGSRVAPQCSECSVHVHLASELGAEGEWAGAGIERAKRGGVKGLNG